MSNKTNYQYSPQYRKSEHSTGYKVVMVTAAIVIWAAVIVGAVLAN